MICWSILSYLSFFLYRKKIWKGWTNGWRKEVEKKRVNINSKANGVFFGRVSSINSTWFHLKSGNILHTLCQDSRIYVVAILGSRTTLPLPSLPSSPPKYNSEYSEILWRLSRYPCSYLERCKLFLSLPAPLAISLLCSWDLCIQILTILYIYIYMYKGV